jgi:hypothetical protein
MNSLTCCSLFWEEGGTACGRMVAYERLFS